jgi:hypothetical protein
MVGQAIERSKGDGRLALQLGEESLAPGCGHRLGAAGGGQAQPVGKFGAAAQGHEQAAVYVNRLAGQGKVEKGQGLPAAGQVIGGRGIGHRGLPHKPSGGT